MANNRLTKSRRVEHLIRQARKQSNNETYTENTTSGSTDAGIGQAECVQYLNDAQAYLIRKLVSKNAEDFTTEDYISVVAGTEEYDLPPTMLRSGGIVTLEYTDSGSAQDYRQLVKRSSSERPASISGTPYAYIRRGSKIILINKPNKSVTNGLRLQYVKRIERLNVRLGTISARALTGTALTSITIDTTNLNTSGTYDDDFICVVDLNGDIKARNIPFTVINSSSGVITCSHTLTTGESITVGDYVVIGRDCSTHAHLDEDLEGFLIGYLDLRLKRRDSSRESVEAGQDMQILAESYLEAYGDPDEDLIEIPESGTTE